MEKKGSKHTKVVCAETNAEGGAGSPVLPAPLSQGTLHPSQLGRGCLAGVQGVSEQDLYSLQIQGSRQPCATP